MSELVEVKNSHLLGFVLAGNCLFTIVNESTKNRFTFRVRTPEEQREPAKMVHFVEVLAGPDNGRDYVFLGSLFNGTDYVHSNKSKFGRDCQSETVFVWLIERLLRGLLPESVKLYHHGRCGRCGRILTVPDSIRLGLGPECASKAFF
jgi:hypothetical protein